MKCILIIFISYYVPIINIILVLKIHIKERILQHQNGINPTSYTYNKRPIRLVYTEEFIIVK
jgi:hypothetical protein